MSKLTTFQVEHYDDCHDEIDALLRAHFLEVALHQNDVPLSKDEGWYQYMADTGQLHILTVRVEGELVGYHASFIRTHPHYKTTLHANTDVYYIKPEHRLGRLGIQLFIEVEKSWKKRGVVKAFTGTKLHKNNMSKVFERLGWTPTEMLFSKIIKD